MEKQTQRKRRAGKSDRLSSYPLLFSLSQSGAVSKTRALHSIDRNGDLTKTRKLHSTNYLSAGVSAAERPTVTREQPDSQLARNSTQLGT